MAQKHSDKQKARHSLLQWTQEDTNRRLRAGKWPVSLRELGVAKTIGARLGLAVVATAVAIMLFFGWNPK
jgi:hypothetical protein